MADCVLCAEAVAPIAEANARNVIASKLFFSLFCIFELFFRDFGGLLSFAALRWPRQVGEYPPIYSDSTKNSNLRDIGWTLSGNT